MNNPYLTELIIKALTKSKAPESQEESLNPRIRMTLPSYEADVKSALEGTDINYDDIQDNVINGYIRGTDPKELVADFFTSASYM